MEDPLQDAEERIGGTVIEIVRKNGFSHKTYQVLEDLVNDQYPNASGDVIGFIDATMDVVWDEIEQLKPRQVVPGDGRIIESVFGKFKQSSSSQLLEPEGVLVGKYVSQKIYIKI